MTAQSTKATPTATTAETTMPTTADTMPPFTHWLPTGLRARILAWFIGVFAVTTIASVAVTAVVLDIRVDQRVDAELVQEAAELRRLARGNDPATGQPFGRRVRRIFDVYLERNVP
jgi:hypothetical protein